MVKNEQMREDVAKAAGKAEAISVRVIIVLAIAGALLLVLAFITDDIVLDNGKSFDEAGFRFLQQYINPATTRVMLFFTFFGSQKFLLPAWLLLVLYYIFFKKNNRRSLNISAIGISSVALLFLVKIIFKRHRPPHPLVQSVQGFSYPSGHSFSAFTFCFVLIYLVWQSQVSMFLKLITSVALFAFAAIIALSRVYLHVHYPSDVLAGFCLSFVWLVVCVYLLRKIHSRRM